MSEFYNRKSGRNLYTMLLIMKKMKESITDKEIRAPPNESNYCKDKRRCRQRTPLPSQRDSWPCKNIPAGI